MRTGRPQAAIEAVTWRRLPFSSWPWRSLGYLLITVPVAALPAAAALAVPAVPWLVLAAGHFDAATIVVLALLGAALVAAFGPLIAVPVAVPARWRLRFADTRPRSRRPTKGAAGGPIAWLRARYADPVAWRETGYLILLATLVPALCVAALLLVLLAGVLVASPFMVAAGLGPIALMVGQVSTVRQAVPYAIVGIALLPLLPYVLTLVAGADAAVARAMLLSGGEEQLRAELTEVSASRARLADAFEAERLRIERDLHDGAQQKLVALTMQLGLARMDLPPGSPGAENVAAAHEQAKQLMAELRELIHGIQPQVLTDLGLPAALGELADQSPIPVTVDAHLTGRMPAHIENTAYFAAAEALTNIAKHSSATSATMIVRHDGKVLTMQVSDNGRGGADPGSGSGLTGLADRVAVVNGRMLLSSPAGGPTVVRVEVPCRPGRQTSR